MHLCCFVANLVNHAFLVLICLAKNAVVAIFLAFCNYVFGGSVQWSKESSKIAYISSDLSGMRQSVLPR